MELAEQYFTLDAAWHINLLNICTIVSLCKKKKILWSIAPSLAGGGPWAEAIQYLACVLIWPCLSANEVIFIPCPLWVIAAIWGELRPHEESMRQHGDSSSCHCFQTVKILFLLPCDAVTAFNSNCESVYFNIKSSDVFMQSSCPQMWCSRSQTVLLICTLQSKLARKPSVWMFSGIWQTFKTVQSHLHSRGDWNQNGFCCKPYNSTSVTSRQDILHYYQPTLQSAKSCNPQKCTIKKQVDTWLVY